LSSLAKAGKRPENGRTWKYLIHFFAGIGKKFTLKFKLPPAFAGSALATHPINGFCFVLQPEPPRPAGDGLTLPDAYANRRQAAGTPCRSLY
jgi:hypothetical protein